MKTELEKTIKKEGLINDLKLVRRYFGENDKTATEHMAYGVIENTINFLSLPNPPNN